ncbi:MAG: hypothetical protein H7Y00_16255 [Fimbriimonadaceae bacterium]|nr:hypothetical protein [Chitinophagales bacterium]
MGANKFIDDPITIKFRDDLPTIKFLEDAPPTLKFFDDGGGWPTIKFADDPSLKFAEDPQPTSRWGDDPNTWVENTNTMVENIDPGSWRFDPSIIYSAQPFVLANPHHSMDWTKTFGDPNEPANQLKYMESQLQMVEQSSAQMQDQLKQITEYGEKLKAEMKNLESAQKKSK